MVEPAEDVANARLHEDPRGPLPAWIQCDRSVGSAQEVDALGAARRQKADVHDESVAKLGSRVDGEDKIASVRADRILEMDVEVALVPEDVGLRGERRAVDQL